MNSKDLPESVLAEAAIALEFAADKGGLSLHGVNVGLIAPIVAVRAILAAVNSGAVVSKESHDKEVDHLKRRASRFENSWASVLVSADQQLQRAQRALSEMEDQDLAERLAEQIGVILPEPSDALFEATK